MSQNIMMLAQLGILKKEVERERGLRVKNHDLFSN